MDNRYFPCIPFRSDLPSIRWWTVGTCVASGLLLVLISGCGRGKQPSPMPVAVHVTTLANETVASPMRFSAVVREWQRVNLSFKVPGTVKELLQVSASGAGPRDVQEGDVVTADSRQALARLDDADYQRKRTAAAERLAQLHAKEQVVLAKLAAAESDYRRMKALSVEKAIAEQTMEYARAQRDSLSAEREACRREIAEAGVALQQAEDDLRNCTLAVPMPQATVAKRLVEPHERVEAGQPVFQIMDVSRLRVAFGVPDIKLPGFRLGQTLTVLADAFPEESFPGQVTKIHPAADARTRTFEIEVRIDRPRGLKPGMVVTILNVSEDDMVLLPLTAVRRGNRLDEFVVYAVRHEQGVPTARRRRVQWDGVHDNQLRLLDSPESEVRAGDVIVVSGAVRLTDGDAVHVLNRDSPETQDRI